MISRGLQVINYGPQSFQQDQPIQFNKLITSWPAPGSSPSPITYNNRNFYISNATLSDYLITWVLSLKTATVEDSLKHSFLLDVNYPYGFVTEGCSSPSVTTTGLLKGYKVLHVTRKSTATDNLSFCLKCNTISNTIYLQTPSMPLPKDIYETEIANASLSIISI